MHFIDEDAFIVGSLIFIFEAQINEVFRNTATSFSFSLTRHDMTFDKTILDSVVADVLTSFDTDENNG